MVSVNTSFIAVNSYYYFNLGLVLIYVSFGNLFQLGWHIIVINYNMLIWISYALVYFKALVALVTFLLGVVGNVIILIIFFTPSTPFSPISILWEDIVAPFLTSSLGISRKQPVTVFIAPFIFLGMLSLMIRGFLPYAHFYMGSIYLVGFISLWMWLTSFLYLISSERFSLTLMVPGVNMWLGAFMMFIEFISTFVKPVSLTIRLYANLMFGHYLLSVVFMFLNWLGGPWLLWLATPFVVLELAVFLVQAYIFTYLVISYYGELY